MTSVAVPVPVLVSVKSHYEEILDQLLKCTRRISRTDTDVFQLHSYSPSLIEVGISVSINRPESLTESSEHMSSTLTGKFI